MISIRRSAILIIVVTGLALALNAQVAAQPAEAILRKAARATGLAKGMSNVESTARSGRIVRLRDGATGTYSAESRRSGIYFERIALEETAVTRGFNGKSAWERDTEGRTRTLTGAEATDFQAESLFHASRWLNIRDEKIRASVGGGASVNGKTADTVVLTTEKNVRIKLFFETASRLLVRMEVPFGDGKRIFEYADYRVVNEVKEPFSIRFTENAEVYEIRVESIGHNTAGNQKLFDFPGDSSESLPDVRALLEAVKANQARVDKSLESYSFIEEVTEREFDSKGALAVSKVETFEVSNFKGQQIRRLTARDGRSLSDKDQANQDRTVQKEVERIDKTSPDALSQPTIADILRASRLINPRRESFGGRTVIVFDFEPDPQFSFAGQAEELKFFGKLLGTIWIDEADRQVARLEAKLAESFKVGGVVAKIRKGGYLVLEQRRFDDEVWLPYSEDVNISLKILLVKTFRVNQISRFSNYRKFSTEVKESVVDQPSN